MDCVEVRRRNDGTIEISGAAEIECWEEVRDAMESVDPEPETLMGWRRWDALYTCVDRDGEERHYFVCHGSVGQYMRIDVLDEPVVPMTYVDDDAVYVAHGILRGASMVHGWGKDAQSAEHAAMCELQRALIHGDLMEWPEVLEIAPIRR